MIEKNRPIVILDGKLIRNVAVEPRKLKVLYPNGDYTIFNPVIWSVDRRKRGREVHIIASIVTFQCVNDYEWNITVANPSPPSPSR